MIRVDLAPEPASFDRLVRAPGNAYLATQPFMADVNFTGKEYWRRAIPDLGNAYSQICAYTCHRISLDTGASSADHFVPRKLSPNLAYEWANLRFVCSRLNARKGIKTVVDPFEVQPGMFRLQFPSLFIFVGEEFSDNELLSNTIDTLKLNDDIIVSSREEYISLFVENMVNLEYLALYAPFLFLELMRQGLGRDDLIAMGF